jgi:hypothetical protein
MSTASTGLTHDEKRNGGASGSKPFAVDIPEALRLLGGMSRSSLYVAIGRGELEAVKDRSRTLITTASIEARQRALPAAQIKAPPR